MKLINITIIIFALLFVCCHHTHGTQGQDKEYYEQYMKDHNKGE